MQLAFRETAETAERLAVGPPIDGYYFKVLLDRMSAARSAAEGTGTRLNLQVLSDSNITPLLTMLGAAELASRRPYLLRGT